MDERDGLEHSGQMTGSAAMDMWQVSVNRDICLGSGMCISAAPNYFRMEAGRSTPARPLVPPDPELEDAAELCPVLAIRVRRATDGTLIAPVPDGLGQ